MGPPARLLWEVFPWGVSEEPWGTGWQEETRKPGLMLSGWPWLSALPRPPEPWLSPVPPTGLPMAVGGSEGRPALLSLLLAVAVAASCSATPIDEARRRLLVTEGSLRLGGRLALGSREELADRRLMALKQAELQRAARSGQFPPSMHFFRARPLIEQSEVFRVLQKMPKGRGRGGPGKAGRPSTWGCCCPKGS